MIKEVLKCYHEFIKGMFKITMDGVCEMLAVYIQYRQDKNDAAFIKYISRK